MKSSRAALELSFSTSLIPVAQAWRGAADKAIPQALGISHALAWPLVVIHNSAAPLRQSDLAALLGIAHSSLVRLIDQLCASALVERVTDVDDRRANTLRLTDAGEQWSIRLESEVARFRAKALAGISEDDLATCLRVFSQIRHGLDARAETSVPGRIPDRSNPATTNGSI